MTRCCDIVLGDFEDEENDRGRIEGLFCIPVRIRGEEFGRARDERDEDKGRKECVSLRNRRR